MSERPAAARRTVSCPSTAKGRCTVVTRTGVSLVRRALGPWATATVDVGGAQLLADLRTPYGLYLYRLGFPEPEARLIRALLRPGDVFIDGGAHIGTFTVIAAAVVGPEGRVLSCEPSEGTRRLLERNVRVNRLSNVEILPVAIAERAGTLPFFSFSAESALSSFAPARPDESQAGVVEVASLDEIAARHLDRVRLVKLDIEGAEVRALRGAQRLLQAGPDFVVEVEPEHLARQGTSIEELQAIFEAAGYVGYLIREAPTAIELEPLTTWVRPPGNPNLFVSRSDGTSGR